jgi:hypothetical protein
MAVKSTPNDRAGLLLLRTAAESLDRMREAQAILAADGMVITDRFGQRLQPRTPAAARSSTNWGQPLTNRSAGFNKRIYAQ